MIPQSSPEWLRARIGCLTASRMKDAVAFLKNGNESADRNKLKIDVLAERLADTAVEHYVTPAMQWGLDMEDRAKEAYEVETGNLLFPAGFILHPNIEFFGASPDALIGQDALAEFKCPTTQTHVRWILNGVVPEEHKPQMLAQLACTRRRWCDFASFDPRLPEKQRLFIRRFEPTADDIAQTEAAARQFLAEVEAMFEAVTTAA